MTLRGAAATSGNSPAVLRCSPRQPRPSAACRFRRAAPSAGNVANASPAADSVPPLLVYDARVHVASASGRRVVPIDEMFAGVKKTTLEPGELIEAIELPMPARPPDRQIFRKVGTRAAQAISKIVLAGCCGLAKDATVPSVRLALGSMAPTPRRLRQAEAVLKGRRLIPDIVSEAVEAVAADVSPIDDVRSTSAYRLGTAQRIVAAFLEQPESRETSPRRR